jgi:hypothetical protein
LVRRFQDRWETTPQYRAMVSGGVGLVLLLTLCTCTGVMSVVGNNALVSLGLASANNSTNPFSNDTGTNKIGANPSFPTATIAALPTGGATPEGSPFGDSLTPVPDATATPTESINPTPTSGGGNNSQFICTQTVDSVTWTFNPCPLMVGESGSMTIDAPTHPNTGTNIIVSFGACPRGDCTVDDPANLGYKTNASGVEVISFTVAADVQVGGPPVTGEIQFSSGPPTIGINTQGGCQ